MNLRIIKGPPNEETQAKFETIWKKIDESGHRINEKLTTTHIIGSEIVYSIVIEPKPRTGSKSNANGTSGQMTNRLAKIEDPTELEQNLMSCFGTRSINPSDREKIELSGLTLEDSQLMSAFYAKHKRMERTEKNSMGMKTTFAIFVNQLSSQREIANEWSVRRRPRENVIDEPSWDWQEVRDQYAQHDDSYKRRRWDELSSKQKKNIMRLRG